MATNVWLGLTADSGLTTNWSDGTPTTSDVVYLTGITAYGLTADLTDLAGITLTSFNIDMSFTPYVGSATAYLQLHSPIVNIGTDAIGNASGSGRIKLDFGANATVVGIYDSASNAADANTMPIQLLGSSITSISQIGGSFSIAYGAGETATVTLLHQTGGEAVIGAGCTVTTITNDEGTVNNYSTVATTLATIDSSMNYYGSGGFTTLTIQSGARCVYTGTGTIGTLNLNGLIDFSKGTGAVTITNMNRSPNGKINDPNGRVVMTNPCVDIGGARMSSNNSDFGPNRSWKIS